MLQLTHTSKKIFRSLAGAAILSLVWMSSAMAQSPIVFVHGYAGANWNWDIMTSRFTSSGYPSSKLYKFGYNSLIYSDKTSASQLNNFVNSVRSSNGYAPVDIVAHSNGGLVARWFRVKLGGTAKMRRFVTLGTPHRGTNTAYACISPACFEMRPGSSFINDLAGQGCDRSLWSAWDEIIIPQSNAQCGWSTQTANVGHLTLLAASSVYDQVRQQLQ